METTINKIGTQTIVVINGRLDTPNSKVFEENIQPILEDERPDVCIDCAKLEYISSSGLRQFLTLLKYTKNVNGTMVVKNLNSEVKEVFDMTGFSGIFNL
ncbi:MAG: STAS domain-containing protein [Bacteroides sp.]|uniref:STAS domain-containing protein n=1 Tax=Bacteroides sp. TaxID=29523 RepID=UPI002FCBAD1F